MRVFTSEEMRAADRSAIDDWEIDSLVLMENAALGVVEAVCGTYADASRVVVFCGPGNNGGDGLAIARHLTLRGFDTHVVLVGWSRNRSEDAERQSRICSRQRIPMASVESADDLAALAPEGLAADLWIDAMFGTGLSRPLEGYFAETVRWLSSGMAPVVAVDLPSGLDASIGDTIGPCVRADLTVALGALKRAHVLAPASGYCGTVRVADLGMPDAILSEAPGFLHLLEADTLRRELRSPDPSDHKGRYGHCLLVAGSNGKAGAALLAGRGALVGGAGLVTLAVPRPLLTAVDAASFESMTLPLAADGGGALTLDAAAEVLEAAEDKSCLAIGPGLGTSGTTMAAVRLLLERAELPTIVDADGLNALAGHLEILAEREAPTILTPHPGEAARLFDSTTSEIQADRIDFARSMAMRHGCVLVLKGHQTVVASPDGTVHLNSTGNPGMATGGSGDVLTGLIAALVARQYDPLVAARLGVFIHGLAGDLALERGSVEGLVAGDLIETIPAAFGRLRGR